MKALRWYGKKALKLEDIPEPIPAAGQVKVKVAWCGICGSDLHEYEAGPILIRTDKPHPVPGSITAPVVLGHELAGEVVEVGPGVEQYKPGDRVTIRPTIPCYQCHWCQKGDQVQCATLGTIGFIWDGGFAEYMVAPTYCVYPIPDELTFENASFVEPLAVAIHAVNRSGLRPGDTVAVVGLGPIGLLTMQAAKACGASTVFGIESLPQRAEMAKLLGAQEVFDPTQVDAGKEIAKFTDGLRADIAFECAGPPAAMLTALKATGKGGTIVEVGQMVGKCEFPFVRFWLHEKTVVAAQGYSHEFPTAIAFLADKRVLVEPLVTARLSLDEVVDKGFDMLSSEERLKHIKVIVRP